MPLLVSEIFRNAATNVPHRPALHIGEDAWTFGDLDTISEKLAHTLLDRGIGSGDLVAHRAPIGLPTVALFIAAAKLGAVYVPLDPALSAAERGVLEDVVRPVLSLDESQAEALLDEAVALGRVQPVPDSELREDAHHVLFFTSGSTGAPKGIPLSNRVSVLRSHPGAQPEARGPALCPFPLFHVAAWTIALQQWQNRAALILPEDFSAGSICAGIVAHRAERIYCIPAIWRRILDYVESQRTLGQPVPDLSSIRWADTGTSATPPSLIAALRELLPQAVIRVFYGSTEAGPVTCLEGDALDDHPHSCGLPMHGVRVRVSEDGELELQGPNVFDGHLGDGPSAFTADRWLRTGDLAEIDDEGYVSITGRVKDVIRSGGHTVAPSEVEAVLATLPGIADVAVVGLPDPDWGEVVCAVIVPRPGQNTPGLEFIRRRCADRLAPFKHPRRLVVVDAIPRTASTHQVKRHALVASLQASAPVGPVGQAAVRTEQHV